MLSSRPNGSEDLSSLLEASDVEPAPARILLAEDDAEMRALLGQALREEGYQVVEARDGAELLSRIKLRYSENTALADADLIITDVMMPGYTGLEILEALRHVDWATSVILVSAFADAEMRSAARAMGAAALIAKPFGLGDFLETVRRVTPPRCASSMASCLRSSRREPGCPSMSRAHNPSKLSSR